MHAEFLKAPLRFFFSTSNYVFPLVFFKQGKSFLCSLGDSWSFPEEVIGHHYEQSSRSTVTLHFLFAIANIMLFLTKLFYNLHLFSLPLFFLAIYFKMVYKVTFFAFRTKQFCIFHVCSYIVDPWPFHYSFPDWP